MLCPKHNLPTSIPDLKNKKKEKIKVHIVNNDKQKPLSYRLLQGAASMRVLQLRGILLR